MTSFLYYYYYSSLYYYYYSSLYYYYYSSLGSNEFVITYSYKIIASLGPPAPRATSFQSTSATRRDWYPIGGAGERPSNNGPVYYDRGLSAFELNCEL